MPLCLNTSIGYEEFVSCLTSPRLQNWKRGHETLTKPRERERTLFSVTSKEGRAVKQSGIYIFKYLDTHFSVSKSAIHKFKHLISVNGAVCINYISK
jgi:hypothetical protein